MTGLVTPRDPRALVALARELHARGDDVRSVLCACYGVSFPEEAFVVLDDGAETSMTTLPWQLATLEDLDGELWLHTEDSVYRVDRELVPLYKRDQIACYRLDELAAGRPTIFTLPTEHDEYTEARRAADSLLAYLHADAAARLARDEAEYASESNRGAGSIDAEEVSWSREAVQRIERLQRELAARAAR